MKTEAIDHPNKTFASQIAVTAEECAADYAQMVREGFPLGKGYYLRVYPAWFSFRGNYNVLLSENKAMPGGAKYRNDYDLYAATQHNYEWIIGKNPMAQSTMVGEGYDFIQHYTVQPGQTTGSITVGMESHYEKDEPYWPQVNTATYKEVWVCSATEMDLGYGGFAASGTCLRLSARCEKRGADLYPSGHKKGLCCTRA